MPQILIMSGYGLNCEDETLQAFELAGFKGQIIHVNDIIENKKLLQNFQALAIPGGFSYGDDTGSGNALANRIRWNMWDELVEFINRDTLTIGICNGCQVSVNLGLVPALSGAYGKRAVAMLQNSSNVYQCRWVYLKKSPDNKSPWLKDIDVMHVPVAHGEGNFYMEAETLAAIKSNGQIAFQYTNDKGELAKGAFPINPNGAMEDIAAITDSSGRILSIMPHPERGMLAFQTGITGSDNPTANADGMKIFTNAARYFA